VLLGWQPRPALNVELAGDTPNRVGDSLFLVPLSLSYDAQAAFTDRLLVKTIIETKSDQAWFDGNSYNLNRGTMTVELRPASLAGKFKATGLQLALTQGNPMDLNGSERQIEPLPDVQQPDQANPAGTAGPGSTAGNGNGVPVGGAGGAGGGGTDPSTGETPMPAATGEVPPESAQPMPFPGKPGRLVLPGGTVSTSWRNVLRRGRCHPAAPRGNRRLR